MCAAWTGGKGEEAGGKDSADAVHLAPSDLMSFKTKSVSPGATHSLTAMMADGGRK